MKTNLLLLGSPAKCPNDDDKHASACVLTATGGFWMNLGYHGIYQASIIQPESTSCLAHWPLSSGTFDRGKLTSARSLSLQFFTDLMQVSIC
eukprot:s1530_g6.t1